MRALLIRIWLFLSVLWVSFGGALAVSNDPFSAGLRDRFASLPSGVAQIGLSPIEYGRLALYLILIFCHQRCFGCLAEQAAGLSTELGSDR
jgi:hypothetical protein